MTTVSRSLANLLLLAFAPSVLAQTFSERTAVVNMGLHGPVHSVRVATKKLNPDPRVNPKLPILTPSAWVLFDSQGRVVEQSTSAKADGAVVSMARTRYDSAGEQTKTNGEVWRTETQMGPHGPAEIKTFSNDRLFTRETRAYDDAGICLRAAPTPPMMIQTFAALLSMNGDGRPIPSYRDPVFSVKVIFSTDSTATETLRNAPFWMARGMRQRPFRSLMAS